MATQHTPHPNHSNDTAQKQSARRAAKPAAQPAAALTLQRAVVDPAPASPSDILALQRAVGNRAVQRLLASRTVQAKLTVGPAHDQYEDEADRVADQVMRMPLSPGPEALQREDEPGIRAKPIASSITPLAQRQPEEEEEEIQQNPDVQRATDGFEASSEIENRLSSQRGQGSPLPDATRAAMEQRFGSDFGGVRVHTGGEASQMTRDLSAQAFTHGNDVYFGAGKYNPASSSGQHLLAHELTHIVQQGGAGVSKVSAKPDPQAANERPNDPEAGRVEDTPDAPVVLRQPINGSAVNRSVIRRAIGFEFEVPAGVTRQPTPPLTKDEKSGKLPLPAPAAEPKDRVKPGWFGSSSVIGKIRPLWKMAKLFTAKHFTVEADEAIMGGGGTDLEMVTTLPPFQETDQGRVELAQTMDTMTTISGYLDRNARAKPVESRELEKVATGTATMPNSVINVNGAFAANPQATAGIRLDQIPRLMKDVGKKQTGETGGETTARQGGREEFMAQGDSDIVGDAPGKVQIALDALRQREALAGRTPPGVGSDNLIGLVSLMASYLRKADKGAQAYAKTIAPFMARTDFARMFKMLRSSERDYFKKNNGEKFVELVMDAATPLKGNVDTPVYRAGVDTEREKREAAHARGGDTAVTALIHRLDALTRKIWIAGITQGVDLLTKKNFPGSDEVKADMESLGALGGKTEKVGGTIPAPIFELRRMKKGVPFAEWKAVALGVFDYIRMINTKQAGNYSRKTG